MSPSLGPFDEGPLLWEGASSYERGTPVFDKLSRYPPCPSCHNPLVSRKTESTQEATFNWSTAQGYLTGQRYRGTETPKPS